MKTLMQTNIYDTSDKICICGTCASRMQPVAYKELEKLYNDIMLVCLEETHINMAISKIISMLRVGKIKEIAFASVDKSYHCVQLHLIRTEIEKVYPNKFTIKNYILDDSKLYEIDRETIYDSKCLLRNIKR